MCEPGLDCLQLNTNDISIIKRIGNNTSVGKIDFSGPDYILRQTRKGSPRISLSDFFQNKKNAIDLIYPSICPIAAADYSTETQQFIIAYPLMKFGSLETITKSPQTGATWDSTAKTITTIGIIHALKNLHEQGIAYPKLNPSKVVFDSKMNPYLVDVWITDEDKDFEYLAPEKMNGNSADMKACNMFSFALMYYLIITGKSPYENISDSEIAPFFFSGQRPEIPDGVTEFSKSIIMQCWNNDSEARPTAASVYQQIQSNFMDVCPGANFADVMSYIKSLIKFDNHKLLAKLGDPSACVKLGMWLQERNCVGLSHEYISYSVKYQSRMQGTRSPKPKRMLYDGYENSSAKTPFLTGSILLMPGKFELPPQTVTSLDGNQPPSKTSSNDGSQNDPSNKGEAAFNEQLTVMLDPDESSDSFSSITNDLEPTSGSPMSSPSPSPKSIKKRKHRKNRMKKSSSAKKFGPPTTDTIFEAAEIGNVLELQRYIDGEGVNINCSDTYRSTPLHLASENGHAGAARFLVSRGGAVNRRDKWLRTPLHLAAQGGFAEIVQILLDHGADVGTGDKFGATALQLAAAKGHKEVVRALLAAGSDAEHADKEGRTPLSVCQDEEILDMLVKPARVQKICFVKP